MNPSAPRARGTVLALAMGAAIALGACSSAATPTPPTPAPATPAPATSAPASSAPSETPAATASPASPSATASPSESSSGSGTYTVAKVSGAAGVYLTGEDGKTLYVYGPDASSPGTSLCNAGCQDNWPPFTLDSGEKAVAGAGVTGKIATIKRQDGSTQVTYNGKPLYYFAGDSKAGDTNGVGIRNWSLAAP